MTTKIEAKKEIHYRCKKCLPAEASAQAGKKKSGARKSKNVKAIFLLGLAFNRANRRELVGARAW